MHSSATDIYVENDSEGDDKTSANLFEANTTVNWGVKMKYAIHTKPSDGGRIFFH